MKNSEYREGFRNAMVGMIFISLTLIAFIICIYADFIKSDRIQVYKQGQIDAITGHPKYQLVAHADSTKTWERIPEK